MPRSTWTDKRLQRLFQRYRLRYWPRSRRLQRYQVTFAELDDYFGQCDTRQRLIELDLRRHPSDRELRATVLHEMCHAVAGPASKGHDSLFFAQLEYLLSEQAPISVGFPENPEGRTLAAIPAKFALCRRLFEPVYEGRRRKLERVLSGLGGEPHNTSKDEIAERFSQAGCNDLNWREALLVIGKEYGFLDIDGRPFPEFERLLPSFQKAHRQGRNERRIEELNQRFDEVSQEQWESVAGLTYSEAGKRLGIPVRALRQLVSAWTQTPVKKLTVMPLIHFQG